jgi:hypothetical protein
MPALLIFPARLAVAIGMNRLIEKTSKDACTRWLAAAKDLPLPCRLASGLDQNSCHD